MSGVGKRKAAPSGGGPGGNKKKKTAEPSKWKMPHHQATLDSLQPGDKGIWVTCHRHKEDRALREISMLFSEYAEKMYGIKDRADLIPDESDDDDIEASIRKEVAALNARSKSRDTRRTFTPMKMNVDCLLFFKTAAPIEPVELVRRICADAKNPTDPTQLKCRYVNRLTPVAVMGKASESGLMEVARKALSPFFRLGTVQTVVSPAGSEAKDQEETDQSEEHTEQVAETKPSTFAIRPTIRNHSILKRDWVIQQTAGLVDQELHKVNLTRPDQVILIDIFQTVCGMSVVGSDWEELRRYNLSEIYRPSAKQPEDSGR